MTPEEYQWHIKLTRSRYQNLNLTYEQAEEIYKYEEERDTYSGKHFFSDWEEWDYQQTIFSEILNEEQQKNYDIYIKENIQNYEQALAKQDAEKKNDIAYHEQLIQFYETDFLPEFFKDPFLHFGWLSTEIPKIEYLKIEYKRFLSDTKREILSNHFRYNRTFKPNELKVSLLRHKLSYLLPDYASFESQMDVPTKSIADYLKNMLRYLPDKFEELLTRKFQELKEFNNANFEKHHGELQGWHVIYGQLTPEEERQHRIMTLLLLDKEKYGC